MTFFPLTEILLYISLLFAPVDATRISIAGPELERNLELRLTVNGWVSTLDGTEKQLWISDSSLLTSVGKHIQTSDLREHVGAIRPDHDWIQVPKVTLSGFTTLEKKQDSFVLRLNDDGNSGRTSYVITYHRPPPADPASALSINVLGAVNKPGTYRLAKGAAVTDAIIAAGGANRVAQLKRVLISRGPAGEKPQVFAIDVVKLTEQPEAAPVLEDRDTVFVSEIVL